MCQARPRAWRLLFSSAVFWVILLGITCGSDVLADELPPANGLIFSPSSKVELTWDHVPGAETHALYRGELLGESAFEYNHVCRSSELRSTLFRDPDAPPPGRAFYYVAVGASYQVSDGAIMIGSLGHDSTGSPRPESRVLTCGYRVYVDPDATGGGTGKSWADAYTTISAAIEHRSDERRGTEIWVTGSLQESVSVSFWNAGMRILGGFSGSENDSWQRDPQSMTPWAPEGTDRLLSVDVGTVSVRVVLENLELSGRAATYGSHSAEGALHCRRCRLACGGQLSVDCDSDSFRPLELVFINSVAECSTGRGGGLRVQAEANRVERFEVRNSWFIGRYSPAIKIHAFSELAPSEAHVRIVGNQFLGNHSCVRISNEAWQFGQDVGAVTELQIGSNVFADFRDVAIELSSDRGTNPEHAPVAVRGYIVGNTFVDGEGDGVSVKAAGPSADPTEQLVECSPRIQNNIFTGIGGYAIREFEDDPKSNVRSDPETIGNDFYGNAVHYLDEGSLELTRIEDVNGLEQASGNFSADPLFVDSSAGDYHLREESLCRDAGQRLGTWWPPVDMDHTPRIQGSHPNVGADE